MVLLFGTNCVGKSAVGEALAGVLDRCAFVEVDALRYMVRGGLVAWSEGANPADHAEAYDRQRLLGYRNAAALARGFAAEGFSSVVEGLGEGCLPWTRWAAENLRELQVRSAVLVCDDATLAERWSERHGLPGGLPAHFRDELRWYRDRAARFDQAVDTTAKVPRAAARELALGLDLPVVIN